MNPPRPRQYRGEPPVLQSSLALSLALLAFTLLCSVSVALLMEPINVGIIGFGRIGNEHAGWLAKANDIRALATADATAQRRATAAAIGLRAYERIDDLLTSAMLDAILVSTPTAMHFDHAMAALSAGKHVM